MTSVNAVVERRLRRLHQLARYSCGAPCALPDFLIVGAQKGGTTSLYSYLLQHPNVVSATRKEVHFFERPENRRRGERWYRSFFPSQPYLAYRRWREGGIALTGEATTYMAYSRTPKMVRAVVPNAKLVFLLRNPVERAFSHYMHVRRAWPEWEPLSFSEAIRAEDDRIRQDIEVSESDEWYDDRAYRLYSYADGGMYARHLKRWMEHFPLENIYVKDSESFFERPEAILAEIATFLGLPPHGFQVGARHNAGEYSDEIPAPDREFLAAKLLPDFRELQALLPGDFGAHWFSQTRPVRAVGGKGR